MTEGTEQPSEHGGVDVPATEDVPSPAQGTPEIGDEEQREGQTQHPAPDDDVGGGGE